MSTHSFWVKASKTQDPIKQCERPLINIVSDDRDYKTQVRSVKISSTELKAESGEGILKGGRSKFIISPKQVVKLPGKQSFQGDRRLKWFGLNQILTEQHARRDSQNSRENSLSSRNNSVKRPPRLFDVKKTSPGVDVIRVSLQKKNQFAENSQYYSVHDLKRRTSMGDSDSIESGSSSYAQQSVLQPTLHTMSGHHHLSHYQSSPLQQEHQSSVGSSHGGNIGWQQLIKETQPLSLLLLQANQLLHPK